VSDLGMFEAHSNRLYEDYWSKWPMEAAPVLYHYTTAEGLAGIVDKRELWLTSAAYLNDSTELQEAGRVGRTALLELEAALSDGLAKRVVEYLLKIFEDIAEKPRVEYDKQVFIGCFSMDKDSLSQWRGYARGEGGFAIGFNADRVWEAKTRSELRPGYWLLPCEYDGDRTKRLVRQYLSDVLKEVEAKHQDWPVEVIAAEIARGIRWMGAGIKNSSFSSENEWRLIYYTFERDPPPVQHRVSSTFTPFVKFSFGDREQMAQAINEVVIGPQRHVELAKVAVSDFLRAHLGREVPVRVSSVPFRSF
jgi:Protein of unknown function (DUF2971).